MTIRWGAGCNTQDITTQEAEFTSEYFPIRFTPKGRRLLHQGASSITPARFSREFLEKVEEFPEAGEEALELIRVVLGAAEFAIHHLRHLPHTKINL